MKKLFVALSAVILMSVSSYVYAQQPGMMGYGMMGPCPMMGQGTMGPGMMGGPQGWYGCGPGMMGQGTTGPGMMGGSQGWCGPGMMGGGMMGPGMMGQYQQPQKALEEKDAKVILENYLQSTRNPNLKLGKIKDSGSAFEAEIVTKENSLVDKITVDKNTGWMHSAY